MSMIAPGWFLTACFFFGGMLAALLLIDAVRCIRWRWRCPRPPVTHGKVDLFNDDGEGHFLSAKLPVAGLLRLIDDLHRGRFG
jgi:hypothetical protein